MIDDFHKISDPDHPANVFIELLKSAKLPDPVDLRHQMEPDKLDRLRELAKMASARSIEIVELALHAKLDRLGPRRID